MLTNSQLNSMALRAKNGCSESLDGIVRHFHPTISRMSRELMQDLSDEKIFEWCCYRRILKAVEQYDPLKGASFKSLVYNKILLTKRKYLIKIREQSSKRKLNIIYLDDEVDKDDRDQTIHETIPDVLADVEGEVITKEMVALLAQGDPKKEKVLLEWLSGNTNDSNIAQMLAHLYGGKEDSHRQAIKRFRKHCQTVLAKSA
ncbi:hypothetical protein ACQKK5_08105 [Brevibacillus panacihumi]|uniref:hypothetical protein n=1 Tax=Brevibacillus panacihumi TaxID=497735 RepID=UPI003D02E9D5